MENNKEQIRKLTNKVHLAGALAELETKDGNTQDGVPYVSLSGAIQCGETPVSTVRFRSFIKSKKKDGTESKNYKAIKEWIENAVPMTKDKEHCTYVDMIGSLTDNPFVSRDGDLVEGVQYSTQMFKKFEEYAASIDIEGFISSINDEIDKKTEEPSGRKKMRLITRDVFGNTMDLKDIIIPSDLVEPIEDNGYERGCTATFFIDLIPNKSTEKVKRGGIGEQRVTDGKSFLEMVLVGADPVIDSDNEKALDKKLIKEAMEERKNHLEEVKDKGYLGGTSNSSTNSSRRGIGNSTVNSSSNKTETVESVDDEDFPF